MDSFKLLSHPLPSPITAEMISPPGQPAILSLTLDAMRYPHDLLDLPNLRQQMNFSLWQVLPEVPQIYVSTLDRNQQLITRTSGESIPLLLPSTLPKPGHKPQTGDRSRHHTRSIVRTFKSSSQDASLMASIALSQLERTLTLEAAVDGWTRALALRDDETSQHTCRVTDLAMKLSRRMGLSEELVLIIRRGAKLHDIGKMGIPDKILLKPGPLNEDDWSIMQLHPVLAYEMLQPIPYIDGMLDIPYCHHERWDGSGYPRRLKGDGIPLTARIFSVVDVWDALCSDRPYRKAWTHDEAIQYLTDQSGRQFDPYVVAAFLDLLSA